MDILLLHGWGVSSKNFEKLRELLSQESFFVHAFDLPGFGECPPPVSPWSLDDYVEFVNGYAKEKGLQRFFLLGHSFGGRIAIKFALKYPEKLSGLILVAAAGVKPKRQLKNNLFKAIAKIGKTIFSLPILNILAGFFRKILYTLAGSRDYLAAEGVMKATMQNIIREDLTPLLSKIHAPTLLIWGDKDSYTPLYQGIIMKEKISNAEFKLIKGAGHAWYREKPEELAQLVKEFAQKQA